MTTWNERIRNTRERLGIKKGEFAKRVGVSAPTVTDWESGTIKKIDGANLVAAARELHVTPEWIMTGKDLPERGQIQIMATERVAMTVSSSVEKQPPLRRMMPTAPPPPQATLTHIPDDAYPYPPIRDLSTTADGVHEHPRGALYDAMSMLATLATYIRDGGSGYDVEILKHRVCALLDAISNTSPDQGSRR